MVVTETGWVLIGLACVLFFFQNGLYAAMVFFIPFSATAVVNSTSGDSGSALQATMFFGTLWISKEIPTITMTRFNLTPYHKSLIGLLFLFLAVAAASLVMPMIIDRSFYVPTQDILDIQPIPIEFTSRNITQILYLAYGIIIAILVSIKNLRKTQLLLSIKIYVLSGVFISLWGFLQWVFYQFDFPYPDFIFNNSNHPAALGYLDEIKEINLKRISSVAVEPSILAQFLLTTLPFVFFSIYYKNSIFSRTIDKIFLIIIVAMLILCASTSAYVGIFLLPFVSYMIMPQIKKFPLKSLLFTLGTIGLVILAYFFFPTITNYVDIFIIDKPQSYSAIYRLNSVIRAWSCFLEYPVFGIGWGTIGSDDLFIGILAATGVVGFIALLIVIFHLFMHLIKALKNYRTFKTLDGNTSTLCATAVSFIILFLLSTFSGFSFVFGHFWFILGLTMAVPSIVLIQRRVRFIKMTIQRSLFQL